MDPTTRSRARGRIQIRNLSVSHGGRRAVNQLSLEIAAGEFICLLGPSGCGKTTTLRALAGLVRVDEGTIHIDDVLVNTLHAHRRNVAMVFQDLALFPHMTVFDNIAFGLVLRHIPSGQIQAQVAAMLALLHLDGLEQRLPRQLSGGQQQRVAIARSLVVNPSVLLLDEPFAALDRKLREEMRHEIRALQRKLGLTVVFVTHDQEEALTMADRVVVMSQGLTEQVGTPAEIYEAPASRFVLDFVGLSNFLSVQQVERADRAFSCRLAGHRLTLDGTVVRGGALGAGPQIAIRPERIRIANSNTPALQNRVMGCVGDLTYEGASIIYQVVLADGQRVIVREANLGSMVGAKHRQIGEEVALEWRASDAVLIDSAGPPPELFVKGNAAAFGRRSDE